MKITKVTYQKTYSIGPYLTERIGYEADVSGSESSIETLVQLNAEADKAHRILNPHLYQEEERGFGDRQEHLKTKVEFGAASIINIQHEKIQIAIENAKALEELKDIKTVHPLLPVPLMEMYNRKLKQLMK